MYGFVILCLFILIFIVVALLKYTAVKSQKRKDESSDTGVGSDKSDSVKVSFSDDFKRKGIVTIEEDNHVVTSILAYKEDSFVWKCPACETENLSSKKTCQICHYKR